jgi:sulfate permease, SulP family
VVDLAEESGITLRLARLKPGIRAALDRDGVLERVGPDKIHGNVHRAVQAQLGASTGPSGEPYP